MSVRPILLQSDGAIYGTPGAYRTSPPPMAGKYAGSSLREDVTYYTVDETGTAVLKTVKAYPFYCDSVSGGLDTSGDGSLENPFRSVNQALIILQPILTCLNSSSCCTYIVLRVKGTVDYPVQYENESIFNGYDKFIIEPWSIDKVIFYSINGNKCISKLTYLIFKNIEANLVSNLDIYLKNVYLINTCTNSIFNSCITNINVSSSSFSNFIGFYNNDSSIFYKCEGEHYIKGNNSETSVFGDNNESIFYEAIGNSSGYNNITFGMLLYGFFRNPSSAMYECNGNVASTNGYIEGCGFYENTNSTYLNCTGNSLNRTNCDI